MSVLYQRRTSAIASGKRGEVTSVKENKEVCISVSRQVSFRYLREFLVPFKSMGETLVSGSCNESYWTVLYFVFQYFLTWNLRLFSLKLWYLLNEGFFSILPVLLSKREKLTNKLAKLASANLNSRGFQEREIKERILDWVWGGERWQSTRYWHSTLNCEHLSNNVPG